MTNQEKVKEFLLKHKKKLPNKPTIPSNSTALLGIKLIQEETWELFEAFVNKDIVKIADALADLEYVVHNFSLYSGINSQPIFDEVHRSNMTKDGTIREDGKILKGPAFEIPRIIELLAEQLKGNKE